MRYILHVTSRAVSGREEEYDRWYEEVHSVEMCQLPGILSCTRYRELDMTGSETGVFVADYEVETDNPASLLESMFAAAPTMQLSDAIDLESPRFTFLRVRLTMSGWDNRGVDPQAFCPAVRPMCGVVI